MQCAQLVCVLLVAAVLVASVEGRKTSFSSRRKSGSSRRGSSTSTNHKQPPPAAVPATPHRTDSNTPFLNSERTGNSRGSGTVNTHYRDPFNNKPSAPETPKQNVPHTNGPIGFEGLNNQGSHKIGFDKVQNKPAASNVPSAPAYPNSPARPVASAPAGPPPAYPGHSAPGTGSAAHGGYEPPPAYPGRPVNAPPVYSPNNPSYPQQSPSQLGVGGYPVQQGGLQQSAYPQQQGNYPGHSYSGQQGFGSGNNFGNYPNQGYNQGFGGSYPSGGFGNSYQGGFGQPHSSFGGNTYGGSPFGQSNSFGGGGSPFSSGGFGGFGGGSSGGFGGFGGNNHYSPNNFGYSSNPGFFGSSNHGFSGNNYGYHKKSRFGGLPIPIPIPIPIPLGGFGGFGGRSHNHRVLDTFVKNQTVSTSDNETTSVFIINNSTVTPCTTDQFIYNSLNVTVMSCTAGNCTAIKVFVTTYVSNHASVHSAGITMCLEPNATFSTFADNVVPTVSQVHKYWMRACKDIIANTENVTEGNVPPNVTVKITEVPSANVSNSPDGNTTTEQTLDSTSSSNTETTTFIPINDNSTSTGILNSSSTNSTLNNSTLSANTSLCDTFECSWIEMCLPAVELVDRCASPNCPFTRTGYQPCVKIKMCKSPNTPISTFATLNTTISRIDEHNNVTSVNDVANLTLISYIPPSPSTDCSQNATDPSCQQPSPPNFPQQACAPSNSSEVADGSFASVPGNVTMCAVPMVTDGANSTGVLSNAGSSTTESSTTPIR